MTARTQLNRGLKRRLMYVENKDGHIDGADARIGWVAFSKSGRSIFYHGRELVSANGVRGNFLDVKTREEFWVSGVKKRGSNVHWAEPASVEIDDDARQSYDEFRSKECAR
jgi:hypothetical protein